MQSNLIPIPPYLFAHPTEFLGDPPPVPRLQSLPISKLSWENFERLCLRLARLDTELETCRVYGTPGQTQEGIDVYAVERTSGKPRVLQCKRVNRFGPSNLSAAVDLFLNGTWASIATRFTLCTTFRLQSTKLITEIEKQRERLRAAGIQFGVWDAAELDVLLKDQSEIVDDFFGRPWVQLFCPPDGLSRLQNRVTGPTVAEMRAKLAALYTRVFMAHDPGLPVELGAKPPFHSAIGMCYRMCTKTALTAGPRARSRRSQRHRKPIWGKAQICPTQAFSRRRKPSISQGSDAD